ncbi:MAG: hypothetical protein EXS15_08435 [Phycisphaerales bacterium]|nr:hypothetical protein [Phycisphaerales bacterium]
MMNSYDETDMMILSLFVLTAKVLTIDALGLSPLSLHLERMSVVAPDAVVVRVPDASVSVGLPEPLDASRVELWRARSADGQWSGFLAFSPLGGIGWIESGSMRLVLTSDSPRASSGLQQGPWHFEPEGRPSAPPTENLCSVLENPNDDGSLAGGGLVGVAVATLPRIVELAVDADYEFVSMFPSSQAATDYIIALYGANSFILERDCRTRLTVNYIRLFESVDDLYNQPDPLGPFRNEWNTNQTAVQRDLAQLLTGRRNLPYGGVAWLNAACQDYGYSVSGYMIGSFADSTETNPGNWDIIVSTHELGHNLGTYHTHDYGLDTCASGGVQRGTIMSYCHVVSGATSNVDLRFHRGTAEAVIGWVSASAPCLARDCNGNGIDDGDDVAAGAVDANADGIPDTCQDCDGDGLLDPFEIALGATDFDGNGRPDTCDVDCTSDGVPDLADITNDPSLDGDGNFIVDSCQTDCDSNGVADGVDLVVNVARDLDRDGKIDSCEDCDANGIADAADLAGALGVWTVQFSPPRLIELDGRSGVQRRVVDPASAGVHAITAVETATDGSMLLGVVSETGPALFRLDRASAQLTRVTAIAGGFPLAQRIRIVPETSGPDAACDVLSTTDARITRWRVNDGAALGTIVQGNTESAPRSFARHGSAYLLLNADSTIVRASAGGAPAPFGSLGAGADPTDILVASDGRVLVTDRASDSIVAFSATGTALGRFDVGPNAGGSVALTDPESLMTSRQNPNVVFALASGSNAAVHGHRLSDGYYLRTYRIYRVDTVGANAFTQVGASPLDTDMNFELDSCEGPRSPDLNGDGLVDGLDLTTLLAAWGTASVLADLDRNGTVGGSDLTALLAAWG